MDTSPNCHTATPGRILVVDDDPDACAIMESALRREGHDVQTATSGWMALDRFSDAPFDVVVSDIGMNDLDGFDLCYRIRCIKPDTPVIMSTGRRTMESAILAMRAGADDYLVKPIDARALTDAIARAWKQQRSKELVNLVDEPSERFMPTGMIGDSPGMRRVYDLISRVSASHASVLIRGESGTGKDLVARAIHEASPRNKGPFVAINCAAVPETLLESELFGHARGAFTDAKAAREGLFVRASGGTLFLDEIGELPIAMQPKLLRALQERKVRPVGDSNEVSFDARVIVATNRNLETEIAEGRFREDLFYRVNVVTLALPPLRERGADILALALNFLERFSANANKGEISFARAVTDRLTEYDWPGNVRELENCIEHAVALASKPVIELADLPERLVSYRAEAVRVDAEETGEIIPMDELERRYLLRVLKLGNGNKSRAAKLLGLDRRTLYRKLERWGGAEPR